MTKTGTEWAGCFVTDPIHGGKVTCHKCGNFIKQGEEFAFNDKVVFHDDNCFNQYEHYYGLDKPID